MARALKTRAVKSGSKEKTKKLEKKAVAKKLVAAPQPSKEKVKKLATDVAAPLQEKKGVSQKLLETIERRRQEREERFGVPVKKPGRRGRRPKNVEYTPNNNEEDQYVYETENERLEYDTGIRAKDHSDDSGIGGLERIEEFDEELNFDW